MTAELRADPQSFNWLISNFVRETDGVRDAVAVSSDGLLIAASEGMERDSADRLAALVSGLASLSRSAARYYDFEGLRLIMIEMRKGFLLVSTISDGSCFAVLAEPNCDIGLIGYEIAVLVERAGDLLNPALISELREALAR
ncbi:roadblock/LC7 domain-containing protein [Pseudonocardia eucalypti]|uniref:Roadblock/LC7 domain-containing protein n=1 Tax=Pseudonocardia eucalypti TaxID=648755 RepID=A0ABP9RAL6_9PSEU|nr:putative regulator of Ras-like GTPase activity (Roadblock/LC7/MglB family) [Pseudonocardia eucalypti]